MSSIQNVPCDQTDADRRPFVVGLTGGIASGKSWVAQYFAERYGVCVVDADLVARQLVEPGMPALTEIVGHFGQGILLASGQMNRALLRRRIFENSSDRQWLNELMHPLIRQTIEQQLDACHSCYALAVIPLLVETGVPSFIDWVVVVDCSQTTQLARLVQRDGVDEVLAQSMIMAQASREVRLAIAQDVLMNDADLVTLQAQCDALHQQWLQLGNKLKAYSVMP
jgi:dephospho-CoA kinase